MQTRYGFVIVTFSLLMAIGSTVIARPFEPAFKVEEAVGECTVRTPGSTVFVAAEEGQAYAYGTLVKTGLDSECLIIFSQDNTCRLAANTDLTLGQSASDMTAKELSLQEGKVDITLLSNFTEANALSVDTASGTVVALGGKFTVETRTEADLKVAVVTCNEGQLRIVNPYFELPMLNKGNAVSIAAARDDSFIRIKDIRGDFDLRYTNEKQEEKTVAMQTDSVVKIWRRPAADAAAIVVTILTVAPNGELSDAVNFTIETAAPQPTEVVQLEPEPSETGEPVPVDGDDDDDQQPPPPDPDVMFGPGSVTEVPSFTPVGLK